MIKLFPSGILLLLLIVPFVGAITFKWSNKFVYNTDETDSTMAIFLRADELQVCFADLAVPQIPSGRCNLGYVNAATPNITFSGPDVWQTVNGTDPFALRFSDVESVIAYTNGNDSQTGTGKAFVARAAADYRRVEFFPQSEFDDQPNDQSTMVHLNGNFFALCYSMGPNDQVGGCRVGELADDHSVYYGPEFTYYNGDATDALTLVPLTTSKFILCYEQGGNSMKYSPFGWRKRGSSAGNGTCQIATLVEPGRTIQYSGFFNFNPYGVDEISVGWLNAANGTMVICYNNYDPSGTKGSCIIGYLDALQTQITFGARTDYSHTPVDETNAVVLPPGVGAISQSVLVCYVDLNTAAQEGACTLGTVSTGSQITWSYQVSYFNTVTTDEINLIYIGGEMIVLCYVDTPGGSCKFGTMSPS